MREQLVIARLVNGVRARKKKKTFYGDGQRTANLRRVSGHRHGMRWCISWRAEMMKAPSFWYFATKVEAVSSYQRLLSRGYRAVTP